MFSPRPALTIALTITVVFIIVLGLVLAATQEVSSEAVPTSARPAPVVTVDGAELDSALDLLIARRHAEVAAWYDGARAAEVAAWYEGVRVAEERAEAERVAAAARAARRVTQRPVGQASTGPWVIPTYVVMCESGGLNVNNRSGSSASGYYQILDSTWRNFGGLAYAPRAILATRAQQDEIARRILAGQGLRAWSCA